MLSTCGLAGASMRRSRRSGCPSTSRRCRVKEVHGAVRACCLATRTLSTCQQFPLMTCKSYTTYVGGRLSEHFDHPFLSFEATCTIRTDTIPGGKQVHFAVQA